MNKFDMIWDFCPDMMHIIKTFFERLVIGVFSGSRRPTKFTAKEPTKPDEGAPAEDRKKYKAKKSKYTADLAEYEEAITAFDECLFSANDRTVVDERVQNLVGFPYWIKTSMVHTPMCTPHLLGIS